MESCGVDYSSNKSLGSKIPSDSAFKQLTLQAFVTTPCMYVLFSIIFLHVLDIILNLCCLKTFIIIADAENFFSDWDRPESFLSGWHRQARTEYSETY